MKTYEVEYEILFKGTKVINSSSMSEAVSTLSEIINDSPIDYIDEDSADVTITRCEPYYDDEE